MVIGGFAGLTMLTKNSFLEEINKQYVVTARSKGLTERRVLYGHVFRNAMLIVIAGFPSAFVGALFTGSLLTEIIFSLDGLGLLGFEAAINRDYPVMFGTLYFFTLLGLVLNLVGDLTYHLVDPRIDFREPGGVGLGPTGSSSSPRCHAGAAAQLPRQPPGLLVPVDLSGPLPGLALLPSSSPTTSRCWSATRGSSISRVATPTRKPTSAASCRPRPTTATPRWPS